MHHRVLILVFYKGKSAKNEPEIGNFQNLPIAQNSPNSDIHMKQVSHTPFLGTVDDKKWSPSLDLGVQKSFSDTKKAS